MAVFRVERNKGYTVMSNHHLRNKELSLKAKGLLSQMLSLPDDWDYTLKGLSFINREKIDAIREAIRELERAGYIVRSRERDEKGRLRIAGDDYPAELVKSKFMKLDGEHIRFVLDCMRENTTKIRNIKQYLKAALFNAPSTIGNYYTSLVAHDMASGALAPQEPHDPYSFKPGESL